MVPHGAPQYGDVPANPSPDELRVTRDYATAYRP